MTDTVASDTNGDHSARAGIVGYGAIGSAFADLLRAAGVGCAVHDALAPARELAEAAGFPVAASAAELAGACDVVSIAVRTECEVREACCGEDGALAGLGGGGLLLLHSTVHPATVHAVADQARETGVDVVEAPVVGWPARVRAREGVLLVGGEPPAVERATPLLALLAREVIPLGALGSGNVAKLMKNLLLGGERLLLHEAIQVGEAYGIGYVQALEMLRALAAHQPTLVERWQDAFDPSGASSTPYTGSNLHLFDKDVPLALRVAREADVDVPIAEQVARAGLRLVERRPT